VLVDVDDPAPAVHEDDNDDLAAVILPSRPPRSIWGRGREALILAMLEFRLSRGLPRPVPAVRR
jgi:hypothetical protein